MPDNNGIQYLYSSYQSFLLKREKANVMDLEKLSTKEHKVKKLGYSILDYKPNHSVVA